MKSITTFLLILVAVHVHGQALERDEIDKYTKNHIKETTWEPLAKPFSRVLRFRLRSINGIEYIQVSTVLQSSFRIDEGDFIYLLLDNNESVKIECTKGGVADYHYTKYGSWWSLMSSYKITAYSKEKLMKNYPIGIRIDIGDEYTSFDKIKLKNAERIKKAFLLIGDNKD